MLRKSFRHDLGNDLISVVDSLAALEAQSESNRVDDVFGCGGR